MHETKLMQELLEVIQTNNKINDLFSVM